MATEHFKRIADASDLPLIAFQYPLATGQGYPNETILRMIEDITTLKAIKDWAGTPQQHEWHVRTLQNLSRPFNVLSTQSSWLMASLTFGCKGLLSGSGSVIADLQAQLFRAVQAGDLKTAQGINDRIYPLASVFYAQPWVDNMPNRMKEALVLLASCRAPWCARRWSRSSAPRSSASGRRWWRQDCWRRRPCGRRKLTSYKLAPTLPWRGRVERRSIATAVGVG